eukprot:TRINITY_DN104299_c0_g1_i1.p1 TRINITY_DN104299_c0_g1~~TRINITY_DN104299_c0_g1_i1.p1  ORF type:complete len:347 (-),score=81.44 TRINITY_DN104299_c0_g1_i1:39-1079(-)
MEPCKNTDPYALLECTPDMSKTQLKQAYHSKLRMYHPDRRSPNSKQLGHKMTQALYEAWAVIQDDAAKARNDKKWRAKKVSSMKPEELAEVCRWEGNELFQQSRKDQDPAMAARNMQAAVAKYSEGIALAPRCHVLLCNRATCYAMLQAWSRCQRDATKVTELESSNEKGWLLLAQALWQQQLRTPARKVIADALFLLPGNTKLIKLQEEYQLGCPAEEASAQTAQKKGIGGASPRPEPPAGPPPRLPSLGQQIGNKAGRHYQRPSSAPPKPPWVPGLDIPAHMPKAAPATGTASAERLPTGSARQKRSRSLAAMAASSRLCLPEQDNNACSGTPSVASAWQGCWI